MLIAGADTETTGLDPHEDRIIEIYASLWDTTTRGQVSHIYHRIDPKKPIAIEAQRVHGITLSMLAGCPVFADVAPEIRDFLESADVTVGHNWNEFDIPFINAELKRCGLSALTKPTFDTMISGRWATPLGQVPNLQALCFACDVEYDPAKAHAADYDVAVMMECVFKGLDWGWFKLPELKAVA